MERFWAGAWGTACLEGGGGQARPGGTGRDCGALGHLGDSTLCTERGEKRWRVLEEEEIKLACDEALCTPGGMCEAGRGGRQQGGQAAAMRGGGRAGGRALPLRYRQGIHPSPDHSTPPTLPQPHSTLNTRLPGWTGKKETLRALLKAATTTLPPPGDQRWLRSRALAPSAPGSLPLPGSRTLRREGPLSPASPSPCRLLPGRHAVCPQPADPAAHSHPDSPFPSKPKSAYNPSPSQSLLNPKRPFC